VQQGLIGCFRGLVVNGEILDIYSYMSVHLSEIIKDCKPSCDPNPCKNGAKCKELWSTFQCVCKNPWAHVGTYCETSMLLLSFLLQSPWTADSPAFDPILQFYLPSLVCHIPTHHYSVLICIQYESESYITTDGQSVLE
jgi:hypothetical protein